jgi:PAS domain S-box-containing protein
VTASAQARKDSPTAVREAQLFQESLTSIQIRTDRVFGLLMIVQFLAAVVWAAIRSPLTYEGSQRSIHPHLLTAIVLGALITGPTIAFVHFRPGHAVTRICVSAAQMLMGALLIHVSGGRIETHFHVFGSLAFLAFYRDWRILIPATLVVLADHVTRGIMNPLSVYGVPSGAELRFIEHAAWVVFEDAVLIAACQFSVKEMREIASRQAQLEDINDRIEQTVVERTSELKTAEYRYGEVVTHAFDGIIFVGADGIIQEINPSAERIFARSKAEAIGKRFSSLFDSEAEQLFERYQQADELPSTRLEWVAVRNAGETFPVEISIAEICVAGGKALTIFVRDLTDRKALETKLGHAQKMESIGHMATGIAHEINTPNQYIGDNVRFVAESWPAVASIIDQYRAELSDEPDVQERIASAERKADLEFVLAEAPSALFQALEGVQRVETIVRAMKEFAHPGGDHDCEVDVNKIIENAAVVSRNEWKYIADLKLDLTPDLPYIRANQSELGQVVLNMIVNAAHAVRDTGKDNSSGLIDIKSWTDGDWICIDIKDNGSGIPDELKHRIFEPFFTTKGVGIGTGQGLAIAHSVIVDHHQGEIQVESDASGTCFSIRVPIHQVNDLAA